MSGSIRPPTGGRTQTARTAATANTYQNDNYTLAGPPPPGYDPHTTYFDEGYREANPWMDNEKDNGSFSLARTFPHTVRWKVKKPSAPGNAEQIDEEGEKGQAETAPQVPEAEEQHRQRHESEQSTQGMRRQQRHRQESIGEEEEETGSHCKKLLRRITRHRH